MNVDSASSETRDVMASCRLRISGDSWFQGSSRGRSWPRCANAAVRAILAAFRRPRRLGTAMHVGVLRRSSSRASSLISWSRQRQRQRLRQFSARTASSVRASRIRRLSRWSCAPAGHLADEELRLGPLVSATRLSLGDDGEGDRTRAYVARRAPAFFNKLTERGGFVLDDDIKRCLNASKSFGR